MANIPQLLRKIEDALQNVPYPQQPVGLYEPIEYVLEAGGKRIRPMLTLLCYQLYRDDVEQALPVALGLETYHNHTLLHDDLMDHADMRRGRPTVHCRWNANTAILSGDTMLIMAFQHLQKAPKAHAADILQLATTTMLDVCEGQQYDVNFETRTDVTVEEYVEMIRLKTSVLLACAAGAGALAAGASTDEATLLYSFAERIGLAFQLQDDYLDVYGDPAVFGKNIGGDILCGKKTFLLTNALQRSNDEQREQLLQLLENKTIANNEKIAAVTDIYNTLNIPALCQTTIEKFYSEAKELLAQVEADEEKKALLWDFAQSLLGRKS